MKAAGPPPARRIIRSHSDWWIEHLDDEKQFCRTQQELYFEIIIMPFRLEAGKRELEVITQVFNIRRSVRLSFHMRPSVIAKVG